MASETRKNWSLPARIIAALVVLIPCAYGFYSKFSEFVMIYKGEVDGAFAITPIMNYLLASAGFLLLFGWAAYNGMFGDIEAPKFNMLDNEARLDGGKLR